MSNSVLISLIKLNPDIAITIMPFSFCFLSVAIVHHGVIQFHKVFFVFVLFFDMQNVSSKDIVPKQTLKSHFSFSRISVFCFFPLHYTTL